LYSSTGKSFASLGFVQVRYLTKVEPEGVIVNIRKFVPLEVPDKAFQIPFNFRDFLKFDEFLNIIQVVCTCRSARFQPSSLSSAALSEVISFSSQFFAILRPSPHSLESKKFNCI
jgi:hypothetical protein